MLERAEVYDAELMARLAGGLIGGPPTLFPQRGLHTSHRRGASLEFSEHTEYAPGDDLRHLDWRVFGKSDRYFVRRYEDERLSRALFVLDASGSMAYGGSEGSLLGSKYHLAARVAAALAACLVRQGDAVGLLVAGEEPRYLPPAGGNAQLEAFLEILSTAPVGGTVSLSERCLAGGERLGRASALFAVGDFLDEGEESLAAFPLLRARHVLPRVIQVLHPDEMELPFEHTTRFKDIEGEADLVLDPEGVRRAYREEMEAFVGGVADRAASLGVPHVLLRDGAEAMQRLPAFVRALEGRR